MKFLTGLCCSILLAMPTIAQNAREGSVRFNKEERSGVMADYDASKDETEGALDKRLDAAKLGKRHSESGYWKYEGVDWPEISSNKIDVYFNVERHKGSSVVYMMVSTGLGNFVTSATNPQIIENMKAFLTRFKDEVVAYQKELAIAAQQEAVRDAEKKLRKDNRATDRANRRQEKADKAKAKSQEQSDEEKRKLEELEKDKH